MSDVTKPMMIEQLLDEDVKHLSGGELQRVALVMALGKPADIYLIDEPSAYLDSDQRIVAAKVIKRYILHAKKTAFIVEHDFIMATYLADRVVVYDGKPGIDCTAHTPQPLLTGMNIFLKNLEITFRRDPTNFRPRINKNNSVKDVEQKTSGQYFFVDTARDKD
uniref:ABC transporter domain-containing protein n=5 Tax=Rhodosorus marinus TaxID=101924 RepID=A0A7S3E990_9RHOD|mmetsp:Transcript_18460/g.74120  ORF Transcript_18460/g.74120 Transcript_18460/m.74120 type:complete len:164 (+) Transcript_18460:1744-2235(+)